MSASPELVRLLNRYGRNPAVLEEYLEAQGNKMPKDLFPELRATIALLRGIRPLEGIVDREGFDPAAGAQGWFSAAKWSDGFIGLSRWKAYLDSISRDPGDPRRVSLVQETSHIMDQLVDPRSLPRSRMLSPGTKGFRKGLVFGHIQSGKTSSFISVACAAADSGYRLIIVLGGTVKSLREQTWDRIIPQAIHAHPDPSSAWRVLSERNRQFSAVGMARQVLGRNGIPAEPETYMSSDSWSYVPDEARTDVILALKNRTQLQRIRSLVIDELESGGLAVPILILDDECDEAGIMTTAEQKTSRALAALLEGVEFGSYVGYTATPAANFFESRVENSVFPSDFVHLLAEPGADSEYLGVEKVFGDHTTQDGESASVISSDSSGPSVAIALEAPLLWFFLATAARRIREGAGKFHSSMMVNVTRLNDDQSTLRNVLSARLGESVSGIRRPGSEEYERLKSLWEAESERSLDLRTRFGEPSHDFSEVYRALIAELDRCVPEVVTYNRNNKVDYPDLVRLPGAAEKRLVVIGGDLLNRGRTLEGLVSTYFDRSVRTDDSLEQMGRWFGWRNGYIDLCRIWMPDSIKTHFRETVLPSIQYTRRLIDKATRRGLSPKDLDILFKSGRIPSRNAGRAEEFGNKEQWTSRFGMHEGERAKNVEQVAHLLAKSRLVGEIGTHAYEYRSKASDVRQFISDLRGVAPGWLNTIERLWIEVDAEDWKVFLRTARSDEGRLTRVIGPHKVGVFLRNGIIENGQLSLNVLSGSREDWYLGDIIRDDDDQAQRRARAAATDAPKTLIIYPFHTSGMNADDCYIGCLVMYPRRSDKKFYLATDMEERIFSLARKHPDLVAEILGAGLATGEEAVALERLAMNQELLESELRAELENEDGRDEDECATAMEQAGGAI